MLEQLGGWFVGVGFDSGVSGVKLEFVRIGWMRVSTEIVDFLMWKQYLLGVLAFYFNISYSNFNVTLYTRNSSKWH